MRGLIQGIAIHTGANRRKRDRPKFPFIDDLEAAAVAARQQVRLSLAAAVPDRPNSVDHVLGRQVITSGDLRIAGFAAPQGAARLEQPGTCGTVNRTINPSAAEQRIVRRVDNGIDR